MYIDKNPNLEKGNLITFDKIIKFRILKHDFDMADEEADALFKRDKNTSRILGL